MSLERILADRIRAQGSLDIGQFMDLALGHPEYGYYMSRDPFGRGGDFTTAPEISQMFGEMIGVWVADFWLKIGSPRSFVLLECGPGRGTLMADILRSTRHVSGFHEAVRAHLLEISPVLRQKQEQALQGYDPVWHETLETVPDDKPLIVVANEFLDALPFRQFVKVDAGWSERVIRFEDRLFFDFVPVQDVLILNVLSRFSQAPLGSIFEYAAAREGFVLNVAHRIKGQGGGALFIDYGHDVSGFGDTFQAVRGHQSCGVLEYVGHADLTSHVDFEALVRVIKDSGVRIFGPAGQGRFLKNLGIETRFRVLADKNDQKKESGLRNDLHRLIASDEMGDMFKVLCLSGDDGTGFIPAGF